MYRSTVIVLPVYHSRVIVIPVYHCTIIVIPVYHSTVVLFRVTFYSYCDSYISTKYARHNCGFEKLNE